MIREKHRPHARWQEGTGALRRARVLEERRAALGRAARAPPRHQRQGGEEEGGPDDLRVLPAVPELLGEQQQAEHGLREEVDLQREHPPRLRRPAARPARATFVSSGRRHTSWTGDWSSDVCSSDLSPTLILPTLCSSSSARTRNCDRSPNSSSGCGDDGPATSPAFTSTFRIVPAAGARTVNFSSSAIATRSSVLATLSCPSSCVGNGVPDCASTLRSCARSRSRLSWARVHAVRAAVTVASEPLPLRLARTALSNVLRASTSAASASATASSASRRLAALPADFSLRAFSRMATWACADATRA